MIANRTREMRPSGMTRGAYGDVNYGQGYTGTESGNAETAKPRPKVARAVSLSRPYRQLPVFGRLAYPMRGEATNRVLLGRKSPGCPAAVFAAVGTIWGASKLGGRNITKYLQPRNATPREIVIRGQTREADPTLDLGKADGAVEETGASTRSTAARAGP